MSIDRPDWTPGLRPPRIRFTQMFSGPRVPPCSVPVACGGPRCRRVEPSIRRAGRRCDATARAGIRPVNPNGSGHFARSSDRRNGCGDHCQGAIRVPACQRPVCACDDVESAACWASRRFSKTWARLMQLRASASFKKGRHRRYTMARGRSLLPIPTTDDRRLEIGRRDRCIYMAGAED